MVVLVADIPAGVMVMDQGTLASKGLMVRNCMHQDGEPGLFSGRNRNNRNAEHFRKAVQINLHAPLFYDIHHVQRQNHRLSKFDQLEGQIEVPLQTGGISYINDHIDLAA